MNQNIFTDTFRKHIYNAATDVEEENDFLLHRPGHRMDKIYLRCTIDPLGKMQIFYGNEVLPVPFAMRAELLELLNRLHGTQSHVRFFIDPAGNLQGELNFVLPNADPEAMAHYMEHVVRLAVLSFDNTMPDIYALLWADEEISE